MSAPALQPRQWLLPDPALLLQALALLLVGLVAISSASVEYAHRHYADPWYHTQRHLVYIGLAVACALVVYQKSLDFWRKTGWIWLLVALALLIIVLIPGIGHEVKGSQRWLSLPGFTLQPSEVAKMAVIIYLAGYLVRHGQDLRDTWQGFARPMGVLVALSLLLLLEPDFGATVIVVASAFGMLFLAGAPFGRFLIVILLALVALAALLALEPYRIDRITGYVKVWDEPYGPGYQLAQALIAFGRGEWTGVGLGNSVQKLFYLPEAHNDFVFAIWAEETGFIGSAAVIALYVAMVGRIMWAGRRAALVGEDFGAYLCYGVALVFAGQAFVNMGVSSGLLPTKGLTLPFISYGGSSLIVCCAMLALVLRVDRETAESGRGRRS